MLSNDREQEAVELGAGLLLAPNATRILQKLDLLPQAFKLGHLTPQWFIQNQSGAVLRRIRLDAQQPPALSIHRADLLKLLRSNLPAGCLRNNVNLRTVRDFGQYVDLSMADGSVISGKALIAADGIRSTVRAHLFGHRPLTLSRLPRLERHRIIYSKRLRNGRAQRDLGARRTLWHRARWKWPNILVRLSQSKGKLGRYRAPAPGQPSQAFRPLAPPGP